MVLAVGASLAVCCGLPLLVAVGVTAGLTGFLLGGVAAAVTAVVVVAGSTVAFLGRRRSRHGPLGSKGPTPSADAPTPGNPSDTAASRDQRFRSVRLRVSGLDCPACADRVEAALRKEPGILDARLDERQGLALIIFDQGVTSERAILACSAFSGQVRAEVLP